MSGDPYDLERFVSAQAGSFEPALAELSAGRKQTHWMWFVFPQLATLGRSQEAKHYGLSGLDEATAFIQHPILGPRLERATRAALSAPAPSLNALLGSPDDLKFRSSMTLFAVAAPQGLHQQALDHWCDGQPDPLTLNHLDGGGA